MPHINGDLQMPQHQPFLAVENARCHKCDKKLFVGDKIHVILLDFATNGNPIFDICCSNKCVNHAIDDHGNEVACQQAR